MHDWRDRETLAERRELDLSSLPAGRYRVLVGLADAQGRVLPVEGSPGQVELAELSLPYRRPLGDRIAGVFRRLTRLGA